MSKKILVVLCLLLLTSCGVNKKNLYKLTINDEDIYVGYTKSEEISTSFDELEVNDKGVITKITLYPKDYESSVSINNIEIENSISTDKEMYNGYDSNGVCIVDKKVSGKINRIIFYSNILNDDIDELDHITITFE